jgi:succinyl-diaminopimelate desuccinylase
MECGTKEALVAQLQELVKIPSLGGIDGYRPIVTAVQRWLRKHRIDARILRDGKRCVGVWGVIRGKRPGPVCMLNATVDTAPFGALETWTRHPLSAHIQKGWLYGRGSADSKSGVVVFCHVLVALTHDIAKLRGSLVFLFDADEHSGSFGGIQRFVKVQRKWLPRDGVMIGYPGQDRIVIGCRGFFRATLTVHGLAAHSGSSRHRGVNAITRANELVRRIESLKLPATGDRRFGLPPQVTVTQIHGGESFSTVPDRCSVHVDFRLTPAFTESRARQALATLLARFDKGDRLPPTRVEAAPGWPAYRLSEDSQVYRALRTAAREVLFRTLPGEVAGPASIGNYLATLNIDATSGFGVRYRNLHAADECIAIATLEPTFRTYLEAVHLLLR